MLNYSNKIIDKAKALILALRIRQKWILDCHFLPLTKAHRDLYEIIHRHSWHVLNDFPNLIQCRDFNDRVQWLKLFDQDRKIIRCLDKILVREHVRERVGDMYLVKLYQVHEHFSQIDFDTLPNAFVIKTNHDSGSVLLVHDKHRLDCSTAEAHFETALKQPYGWMNGEWAYAYVRRRIFVEELIASENPKHLTEFKFHCVEGKVRFCHYIYDHGLDTKGQTIDVAGNNLGYLLNPSFKLGHDFQLPEFWDEMILVAEELSYGFKCVRVDLLCAGDRIYAGEMTFWPMAGCYKGDGQKKLGRFLDFDRKSFKPFLLPELDKEYDRCSLYPNG